MLCLACQQQLGAIPFFPASNVITQIGIKRFLPPRHPAWVDYRRKGGRAAIFAWVFQRQHQRAVAAHGVAANRASRAHVKLRLNQRWQFVAQIIIHAVMRGPRGLGGVQVKTCALAEVISGIIGNTLATRAGVRHHQYNAQLGGNALRPGFGGEVLVVTGQARQPVQHRRRRFFPFRRQKQTKGHRAI